MSGEKAQMLYEEMGMLESQYASVSQQEAVLGNAFRDAESAAAALRAASAGPGLDVLVPVGSGVFFGASVGDPDRVVINVGAGVAIRKDRAYAANYVESRIKELSVAIGNAAARKQEIAARIRQGRAELEQAARSAMGPARGDV